MDEKPTKVKQVELEELSDERAYLNKELRDNLGEWLWVRCQRPLAFIGVALFGFFTWYLNGLVSTAAQTNQSVLLMSVKVDSNSAAIAALTAKVETVAVMQQRLAEHENRLHSLEEANRSFQSDINNIRTMLAEIRGRLEGGATTTQKSAP